MDKNGEYNMRGTVLDVPFKEKDQVKELGARWDPEMRKWFVPKGVDLEPFARWLGNTAQTDASF